jgi:D-serine deaminase-like pyridoxal phosphate-dependent protein
VTTVSLRATSDRLAALGVVRPTLLVDRRRVQANLDLFAARARAAGVRLRPHVKTHQSPAIAGWQRDAGSPAITVSSLEMAAYFADQGWDDITLALPVNPRAAAAIAALARRVTLGVIVEGPSVVRTLAGPLRVWIEVDVGHHRTGVPWDDDARLVEVVAAIGAVPDLAFAGLLTHAGQSYAGDAAAVFVAARERMQRARQAIGGVGEISVGDTPGCFGEPDWRGVDEVRPGNYVFCDLMQVQAGVCPPQRVACAVACPVLATYADRVVVHGGAVHLTKERLEDANGAWYGELLTLDDAGFAALLRSRRVTGLSQEHGVIAAEGLDDELVPGDVVLVAPVHSCLTCEQFSSYRTLDGEVLPRMARG